MADWRPFRYWTLWISKRHIVTLHHIIKVNNNRFKYMDGDMPVMANMKTQWKQGWFITEMLAEHKMSKYYAEATTTTAMLFVFTRIVYSFRML